MTRNRIMHLAAAAVLGLLAVAVGSPTFAQGAGDRQRDQLMDQDRTRDRVDQTILDTTTTMDLLGLTDRDRDRDRLRDPDALHDQDQLQIRDRLHQQ